MANSFTTLWTNDRCISLAQYNLEGTLLNTLFGGPHTSEPSFRRAGVKAGDYIYPVRVNKGVLYIITRMRVKEILSLDDYIERYPDVFNGCERSPWASVTFANYLELYPERRFLAPTCTDEVILGDDSTPIRLDIAVPSDVLERLRFRSQRRERGLKHIKDGRLKSVIGLQGIYRLSEQSADEIAMLLLSKGKAL
ncbi:MAG: hypothetical protein ACM3PY_07685 [Omnitrophica WOR_2 bacterium]